MTVYYNSGVMAEWLKRQTVNLLGNRRWFESNSPQTKYLAIKLH